MAASYAVSVRQASVLLSASFRFHLAMDTLAVQLVIPLTGLTEDSHLQVILPAPPVQKQLPSGRYAPCPAHHKKTASRAVLSYILAEREGFEPSIACAIHTFQACSFSHSDTSPERPLY